MGIELSTEDFPDGAEGALRRICVIGAGAWGTALASVARHAGREVTLWGRNPQVIDEINTRHSNEAFLPGAPLPKGMTLRRFLLSSRRPMSRRNISK